MPIYVYEVMLDDGTVGETIELLQGMNDLPLERHPETGQTIHRILAAPRVPRKWTDSRMKANLSDKNLDRLGFTKYQKAGDGRYEKRAGAGPDVISSDGSSTS